jgi:uncharacterized protein (TIGR00661 family)
MKILYGIQGTGHGHISRAREMVPLLAEKADVDVLISGYNSSLSLKNIDVTQKRGISLSYDANGGVSYLKTALRIKPVRFLQDIQSIDAEQYDLVISDYEPVTAWASINSSAPSISLSHQAAFLSKKSPRPKHRSLFAEALLKHFAPCKYPVGFHFRRYDSYVLPPVIRQDVLHLQPVQGSHITVYLPAYHHDTLTPIFHQIPDNEWHIFSPECEEIIRDKNVIVNPVGNLSFLKSLQSSMGVLTSAGFETCAEAMFLGKKLMVMPIRNQYEQLCNAAALKKIGIRVAKKINQSFFRHVLEWIEQDSVIPLNEIADTEYISQEIIRHAQKPYKHRIYPEKKASIFY